MVAAFMGIELIRAQMIAANDTVGGDVTADDVVGMYLTMLDCNLDRIHSAAVCPDTGEPLLKPDEHEIAAGLSSLILDAVKMSVALGLKLDNPLI
jgi:hypothetical protein